MSERQRLLYILAPSYSGSTLLTYILGQHPSIATIGELKATPMGNVDEYRCSCGDLITECAFWADVAAACGQLGLDFDVHHFDTVLETSRSAIGNKLLRADVRGRLLESFRQAGIRVSRNARRDLAARLHRNQALTAVVNEIQGGRIFLDSSKDATRLLHFVNSGLWDVQTIHLKRDGRAVTNSISKHSGKSIKDSAKIWAKNLRGIESMRDRLDERDVFDLHYEDFCRNPEGHLERIFNWLEVVPPSVSVEDFRQGSDHILGNAMRLGSVSSIRLDEKWRNEMSAGDKEQFDTEYGALNDEQGYER